MKTNTVYYCESCGYSHRKWFGKCPECDSWEIIEKDVEVKSTKSAKLSKVEYREHANLKSLSEIELTEEFKYSSTYSEFDRVLGSGLVKGSVVLISGSPGIGKSTLLLQITDSYAQYGPVLYVSGEESIYQIRQRSIRLNIHHPNVQVLAETELEKIEEVIQHLAPKVVIIDSIQTISCEGIGTGSISQIKEICTRFIHHAKTKGVPFFIVGHVTKDGKIAGPKLLEHMVDTVLNFEGESSNDYRLIRTTKNRFGATNELAIFEMKESGMSEVKNISEYFLGEREAENIGSVTSTTLNGNRVLLLEVQTLVSRSLFGMPRRVVQGLDFNKVQIVLAVLEKNERLQLLDKDIFSNVPGGMSVKDPAADLAIACSIYSSLTGKSISGTVAFIGELGLRGEVRKVSHMIKRIQELEKCGFQKVFVPVGNMKELSNIQTGLNFMPVTKLSEVLKKL